VAVTKGFGTQAIEAAFAAGLYDIGENYYQEAADKFKGITWVPGARRHFIGRVQRNKARRIAALFDVVQTVDDLEIASALDRGASASHKMLDVLVQVNVAGDERQGVPPDLLADFARGLVEHRHLRVRGIMAMGPADRRLTDDAFARAQASLGRLRTIVPSAAVLSMGMTDDMELALAHGATMLRLGSALFGPRPAR
jgi:pyridoxal phosphate enzyme (YggS family)